MGVAGANMEWDRFICPSCSQWRENTASELVLRSDWGLSSPGKQVGRSSTPCPKRSQVGVEEVNSGQNIYSRDTSVGNVKNFETRSVLKG